MYKKLSLGRCDWLPPGCDELLFKEGRGWGGLQLESKSKLHKRESADSSWD